MPRGRHRHSPPLHRMLPPSAIAGVSVVCALAPWVFSETMALRGFAAAAAATAVVGAVVMRRWDTHAGKQVADLTRARASDEWRHEERVAELEADLDESRELRVKLEQRLRGKRAELAGLRNEHASLLRRYATAETERATVLEERRVLEIEAAAPARALPPVPEPGDGEGAADDAAAEFAGTAEEAGAVAAPAEAEGVDGADDTDDAESVADDDTAEAIQDDEDDEVAEAAEEAPVDAKVFSPEGSRLFLRAKAALARFDKDGEPEADGEAKGEASDQDSPEETWAEETSAEDESQSPVAESSVDESPLGDASEDEPVDGVVSEDESAADRSAEDESVKTKSAKDSVASKEELSKDESPKNDPPKGDGPSGGRPLKDASGDAEVEGAGASETGPVLEDDPQGKPGAVDGHEHAAAVTPAGALATTRPALPAARRPAGHFIEPTAVAVAPAAPVRRPAVEGGFDFFGTKQGTEPSALESVQNEDLADVVGQEALALHKAESEAEFKPADEESRGIGQVIDLTAHDETEQIDIQGLRSAVS
ncbi:hypothetical protein DMH25_14825 [Streptomyces sp. WAC 01325]|uniref:hypothetical protein n=1 Tax=Streptomyces sp. WAC 01325 TaxID=2203202 RepID=UPI000F889243|nr:hypothetical protein [Streptomyces sp. WAC 01325]RSN09616.1 hypothetical protein DMH25_14825 [Streptomyces sp. WAC 01325]